jgi:DNA-binding NtrC family response regulator
VIEEGTGVLVYDAPSDPKSATESVLALGSRALLCVPMFRHGRVVGAVYLDSRRPGAFGDSDRRLLDGFAQLMAAALESSRATEQLTKENQVLREEMTSRVRAGLIGSSRAIQRLVSAIEQTARSQANVLLTGETGTGKDLVARIIHQSSLRSSGPFVSVNCGALAPSMLESELFGVLDHRATGVKGSEGRFRKAHRGTLFLDEIGDMPPPQQVALLSAIANREVTPVGGVDPIRIDVRIVAATNGNLDVLVEKKVFRQDLFFRLNVIRIELPPLRERKGDIPELARHFATQFADRLSRPVPELASDFLADLMGRDWSGNVRELENYIERRMAMTECDIWHAESGAAHEPTIRHRRLTEQLDVMERRMLVEALRRCDGNQSRAARELGLTESTLRNKLTKHALAPRRKLRFR